jgi:UDP-N-acetyl-D-glucosamine dehydrogenase
MDLEQKIKTKKARIGIIGLGYVGLPLAIEFCKAGFQVNGFDVDERKVKSLAAGKSYIKHIDAEKITSCGALLTPTSDFRRLAETDCLLVCVPTPLNRNREPDLSYVLDTTRVISRYLRKGQLIILESTTYPGTTDGEMLPVLEASALKAGQDFFLAYSPEREDPNNKHFSTRTIPKVVGGYSPRCLDLACSLYGHIIEKVVPVSSTQAAEMTKLLENIFRSVNIAMINELKILCLRMGIDIHEVIRAAATKPFGFMPFFPGPGLGGHCIPIDPFYLTFKAREYDISTRFIELAGEINTSMPYFVVQRVMEALNGQGKALKNAKIMILGVAYKKNVDDDREAPSYKLMELLAERGAEVSYNDPHIPALRPTRKYDFGLTSMPLNAENLSSTDCVLVSTDHDVYDYEFILQYANLIVDTRDVFADRTAWGNKVFPA